ncbi:MAG: hypothetical protein KR126chlam2_01130 [Chlamydiae bacterium]|nr:hypothetical protein [Chlamydiota bacterium]
MKKIHLFILALGATCVLSLTAHAEELTVGFVNFKTCIEKSKQGQQDRENFESIKNQMGEALEKTDKELADIGAKLEDQDFMDGLSPTAEEELKNKFQSMNQELMRYQNQYYQVLNQANMKMLQSLHDFVGNAAENVREANHLSLVLNEDSTFAYSKSLDFTDEVIAAMNKQFEIENSEEIASGDENR